MSNKTDKPMMTPDRLIEKMRDEKGITFKYTTEEKAKTYLSNVNNYLRTAAYRQNYQKYTRGVNTGKYIKLDFSYLQEMSTIDMHFRFVINRMCLDVEQALKVKLIKDVTSNPSVDSYKLVEDFLNKNPYVVRKLETMVSSPFTGDLIQKYFTIHKMPGVKKHTCEHKILAYDDCPIWILCEVLTFGDIIALYDFYYGNKAPIPVPVLKLVKSLRNGSAHNNCLLANLSHGTSHPPRKVNDYVKKIRSITNSQRQKKLSCRPMLEFVSLLYTYESIVTDKVRHHRSKELKDIFFTRMLRKKDFFKANDLVKTNYEFACKVINESLGKYA